MFASLDLIAGLDTLCLILTSDSYAIKNAPDDLVFKKLSDQIIQFHICIGDYLAC